MDHGPWFQEFLQTQEMPLVNDTRQFRVVQGIAAKTQRDFSSQGFHQSIVNSRIREDIVGSQTGLASI